MLKKIGLCGSHRTGKTTLARVIAERTGMEFLQTTTSDVFAGNGLNPSEPMDFTTRIWIQQKVVDAAEEVWQGAVGSFITDRTPIDMMAYTLADIQGKTEVDFAALEEYLDRCFAATNKFFSDLVIVQPAIPLIHEEGKAALNKAYMEHLNILVKGLCFDERLDLSVRIMERKVVDLDERVQDVLMA
ncbi:MAG: ATP-binding protein [Desulfobulbaceae bacterium]|nr:ATP-binding protein [Desulfobulbaceae bacterium]